MDCRVAALLAETEARDVLGVGVVLSLRTNARLCEPTPVFANGVKQSRGNVWRSALIGDVVLDMVGLALWECNPRKPVCRGLGYHFSLFGVSTLQK